MKEGYYINIKNRLSNYGLIGSMYWDDNWFAQRISDADAVFFHEPGKCLDPENEWPIPTQHQDYEEGNLLRKRMTPV